MDTKDKQTPWKEHYQRLRQDPEKYALFKAKEKKRYDAYIMRLKQDPERYALYKMRKLESVKRSIRKRKESASQGITDADVGSMLRKVRQDLAVLEAERMKKDAAASVSASGPSSMDEWDAYVAGCTCRTCMYYVRGSERYGTKYPARCSKGHSGLMRCDRPACEDYDEESFNEIAEL